MAIYEIDPTSDPRWQQLLSHHPDASVFHTPAWLRALKATYGYRSLAFTTSAPGQPLRNGLLFCEVKSWLTGSRLVSLPFSDHCQPLVEQEDDWVELWSQVEERARTSGARYVELRPVHAQARSPLQKSASFYFHTLDLGPSAEDLYKNCHKTSVRQCVQRAEREGVIFEQGNSEELLLIFYQLLLHTRRRHHLPPQPLAWFRNLIAHFGDDLLIWTARKGNQPVASILTLAYGNSVVYKYGCSDEHFNKLGGTPALLWRAILYAKSRNAKIFDLGRSDMDNEGLITFKDRLGAQRLALTYYRYTPRHASHNLSAKQPAHAAGLSHKLAGQVLAHLPDYCLTAAGRLLYRHMA